MQSLSILETEPIAVTTEETSALIAVAKVPTFRQFKRRLPDEGLMFSCILHCAALAILPMISPPLRMVVNPHQQIALIAPDEASAHLYLPSIGDSGSQSGSSSSPGAEGVGNRAKAATPHHAALAKYTGPQPILSDPPDATNELQTIRRPDIVAPMKIKAPVRLHSMVQIAAPKIKIQPAALDFLTQSKPVMPQKAEITVNAPTPPKEPVLVVRQSQARPKVVDAPPPSIVPTNSATPQLPQLSGNAPVLAKSVIAVNAVEPPPTANPVIPDAEVSGRFSVGPNASASAPITAAGSSNKADGGARGGSETGSGSGTVASGATGHGTSDHGGSGAGTSGSGSGSGLAGNGSGSHPGNGSGELAGTGTGSGPGAGTGAGTGVGNGGAGRGGVGNGGSMRGLSIAGGKGGGGGAGAGLMPGHSYHLTIIAAGGNGGASRDLGIFAKDQTVYTVSLSMKDAGGGPDWPMQYALFTKPRPRAALSPPYPVKQVKATANQPFHDTSPVFIAAEIDEAGQLASLRAARASDTRAAAAIAVLSQWQFSPAKLDGKAVPAKVVIGVEFVNADASPAVERSGTR